MIWNQEWAWSIQDGLHYYRTQLQGGSRLYGMIKVTAFLETAVNELPPLPQIFSLAQNYPNPFNPVTTIEYILAKSEKVRLAVYDILGQEVKTLVEGNQTAGLHKVEFDGGNLPSGVYLYRIETADFSETKKMLLLK